MTSEVSSRVLDRLDESQVGFLLVLPFILVVVGLFLYPVSRGIWFSLHEINIFMESPTFVGLENYANLVTSDRVVSATVNTVFYSVASVLLTLVIGIATALLLNRDFVGERLFTGLILSPYLLPFVAVVIIFRWFFNGLYGVGNYALIQVGLIPDKVAFFATPEYVWPVLIFMTGWRLYPFVTILILAKLQTIPESYYEAADTMGASRLRQFWSITLPQLRSVLFVVVLLRILWTFNLFDIIWLTTRGGPAGATETLPILAYLLTFRGLSLGEGATVAVLTFLILFAGTVAYFWLFGEDQI